MEPEIARLLTAYRELELNADKDAAWWAVARRLVTVADTALTHEAAVNPQADIQMRAGHSQGSITERYIHAPQVAFPGAAERGEARIFASLDVPGPSSGTTLPAAGTENREVRADCLLPGLDSNQQPSG
jgi:hypothetical protein